MELQVDTLKKGIEVGGAQTVLQERMAGEDEDSRGSGIDMEVTNELEFPEILVLQKMGFVKTNDGDEVSVCDQSRDLPLDGFEEVCFEERRRASQSIIELSVKIC